MHEIKEIALMACDPRSDAGTVSSRIATIKGYIERLHEGSALRRPARDDTTFRLHLIGCDGVEITSLREFTDIYVALFEFFLGLESATASTGNSTTAAAAAFTRLEVGVIGPALKSLVEDSAIDFCLENRLDCHVFSSDMLYHEHLAAHSSSPAPDLLVMFNAGLWGYDSWIPTLEAIGYTPGLTVLVTSYTVLEAEDDFDTIDRYCNGLARGGGCGGVGAGGVEWLWEEERNPHAGTEVINRSSAAPGSEYRDNGAWQCFRINGCK